MTSSISLNKMRFFACHGVEEQERIVGNHFEVSVTLRCDIAQALTSDCLDHTINYAEIYQCIEREMNIPSQLLEHVAGRIIAALKQRFGNKIEGGTITVAKLAPPFKCQLESVAVTVDF
ncbi:MAG: dihydroneopterin aldolase [Muribaculaceae bacterium]